VELLYELYYPYLAVIPASLPYKLEQEVAVHRVVGFLKINEEVIFSPLLSLHFF